MNTARDAALRVIETALAQYPGPSFVACSFGKDSLVMLSLVRQVDPDVPVVWFDGGLYDEWPETYPFVQDVTQRWGLRLITVRPQRSLVEQWRVAGVPWARHTQAEAEYTRQFKHAIAEAVAAYGFTLGFVGMRMDESPHRRRLLSRRGPLYWHKGDGIYRCCPLWNWPVADLWAYARTAGIPEHPLYAKLGGALYQHSGKTRGQKRLGTMAETCFAHLGALHEFRRLHPQMYSDLMREIPELGDVR